MALDDVAVRALKHRIETLEKNERDLLAAVNELLEAGGKAPIALARSPHARG